MAKTVVGLFDTATEAQSVVQELINSGFQRNDISLVANNAKGEYTTSTAREVGATGSSTAEGAGAGAVGGGVLGGVLGLLVGVGALAIPGIGLVVAAGTLATVLGSTALGAGVGAAAGGLIGALVGMGIPEEDANFYAEGVKRGGVLVTVQTSDDRATEALNIMRRANAVDVDTQRNTWSRSGWSGRFDERMEPDEKYTWSGRPRTY